MGARQQWLRTQRVVAAGGSSLEGGVRCPSTWVECAQALGVQRAEEFDERAHLLEPRRVHVRASGRRCSLAGLSPRMRRGNREARAVSDHREPAYAARRLPVRGRGLCAAVTWRA